MASYRKTPNTLKHDLTTIDENNSPKRWERFVDWWDVRRVAVLLLGFALLIGTVGYLNQQNKIPVHLPVFADFYANITTDLLSIALTVLVIDSLNERRATKKEKQNLILQMSSPTNSIALEAVRILRMQGWLTDGTLHGANLLRANLQKAYLEKADLQGVSFYKADLRDAYLQGSNLRGVRKLEDRQIAQVKYLRGAMMQDGKTYDGRYNLKGDLDWARHVFGISRRDRKSMAEFYGVPLKEYMNGQKWAKENLSILKKNLK